MTRLRYTKLNDLLVCQNIMCNGRFVNVVLNPKLLTYAINHDDKTIKTDQATSLNKLKKKAKKALIELGAMFCDEIRNKGSVEKFTLDKL